MVSDGRTRVPTVRDFLEYFRIGLTIWTVVAAIFGGIAAIIFIVHFIAVNYPNYGLGILFVAFAVFFIWGTGWLAENTY